MVLSTTKRTSRRDTLTNRCNGGGCKLAGLAPSVGNPIPSVRSAWSRTVHKTPSRLAKELVGADCNKPGCKCDKALKSALCQDNAVCKEAFPLSRNQSYRSRWAPGSMGSW